jgi:hypothetical protein
MGLIYLKSCEVDEFLLGAIDSFGQNGPFGLFVYLIDACRVLFGVQVVKGKVLESQLNHIVLFEVLLHQRLARVQPFAVDAALVKYILVLDHIVARIA